MWNKVLSCNQCINYSVWMSSLIFLFILIAEQGYSVLTCTVCLVMVCWIFELSPMFPLINNTAMNIFSFKLLPCCLPPYTPNNSQGNILQINQGIVLHSIYWKVQNHFTSSLVLETQILEIWLNVGLVRWLLFIKQKNLLPA